MKNSFVIIASETSQSVPENECDECLIQAKAMRKILQ
jgi:hypothetical protein